METELDNIFTLVLKMFNDHPHAEAKRAKRSGKAVIIKFSDLKCIEGELINADPDGVDDDSVLRISLSAEEAHISSANQGNASVNINDPGSIETIGLLALQFLKAMWEASKKKYPKYVEQAVAVIEVLDEIETTLVEEMEV